MNHRFTLLSLLLMLPAQAAAQTIDLATGGADQIWVGTQADAAAGTWLDQGTVGGADTRRDLIIGAPGTTGVLGRVYVIFGGPVRSGNLSLNSADTVITGPFAGDRFGFSTAAGNIWNTEGSVPRALVVGAPNSGAGNAGKVYLFRGGFSGGATLTTSSALVEIQGQPGDMLGYSLATADLDNDGYREIIAGAPGNSRVYVIKGSATFNHSGAPLVINLATTPAAMVITAPPGTGVGAVLTAGDVTGDDLSDLVIGAPPANAVLIIKGRSSGPLPSTWNLSAAPADITLNGVTPGDAAGTSLRIADIDAADNARDLVIGAPGGDGPGDTRTNSGEVYVIFGTTLAALAAGTPASRSLGASDVIFFGRNAGHQLGSGLAAGDINRDIWNDLVLYSPGAGESGDWAVYYGRSRSAIAPADANGVRVVDLGNGGIDRRIVGDPARGQIVAAQVFEVTGEGARDVVVAAPASDAGAGAVFFTISPKMRLSDSSVSVNLIVNAGQSFSYRIFVNNASAVPITWAASGNRPWMSSSPSTGGAVAGSPGSLDIILSAGNMEPGTYTGTLTVRSTSRDLEMMLPIAVTMRVAPVNRDPGDFSGDGSFDLLWQHNTQGWVSVWRMNGTTLAAGEPLSPDRVPDTNWKIVGTGDFNNDGHPDLLWHHSTQGWVSVWLMNGTNQIAGTSLSPDRVADTNWRIVATGDFNGDGKRDILWQHNTDRWISVWLMNGTTLADGRLLTPGQVATADWRIAGTGDFNSDRKTDIVWHNQATGQISVWYMNGTTLMDGVWVTPDRVPDTNWKLKAIGDVNADGKPDFIWQHAANGALAAWIMNGVTQIRGVSLSPSAVPDLNWKIVGPR